MSKGKTKVLVISSILPIEEIHVKKTENDILLITEDEINKRFNNISFLYIFPFPRIIFPLNYISSKYNSYYKLSKKKQVRLKNKSIIPFPVFLFPKLKILNTFLLQLSLFINRRAIKSFVHKYNPTVTHAHNTLGDALLARYLKRNFNIPYIITLRSNEYLDKLSLTNLKEASSFIALTQLQKDFFYKSVTKSIDLIPHGISESFLNSKKHLKVNNPIRFVVVARLMKLKYIDIIIESLSKLNEDYIFDIYGDGDEFGYLQSLIIKLNLSDKIFLKGRIANKELPKILPTYDVFLMPSYPETFGRVYIEAMACGLPILGAKGSGVEKIITNGKEGFIVDIINNKTIETELRWMFNNKTQLEVMKLNAIALSKEYSWETITENIVKQYECVSN